MSPDRPFVVPGGDERPRCRWNGCQQPAKQRPRSGYYVGCEGHEDYWTGRRWNPKEHQPEKVARLQAMTRDELVAHNEDLLRTRMPLPGLYRLTLDLWRHEA